MSMMVLQAIALRLFGEICHNGGIRVGYGLKK